MREPGPAGSVAAYRRLASTRQLTADPAQFACATALDELRLALEASDTPLRRLAAREPPRGLYIWGPVGSGKTMLMDLFFAGVSIAKKRRVHFNEFMDEVHAAIAARRANGEGGDPVPAAASAVAQGARLICFDEFQVTDIADAMLLGRLFDRLFRDGVTIVATANTAPDRLYENGLNRDLVLPFIETLKRRCEIFRLAAEKDYRRDKLAARPVFFFGPDSRAGIDDIWRDLAGQNAAPLEIDLFGRAFIVPAAGMGAARFSFAALCEAPLGPRDYLRLARRFHSFVIDDVPRLNRERADAARRFVLLIDTLYDRKLRLIASFVAPLDQLAADEKLAPELARTISRLMEMRSAGWLAAAPQNLSA